VYGSDLSTYQLIKMFNNSLALLSSQVCDIRTVWGVLKPQQTMNVWAAPELPFKTEPIIRDREEFLDEMFDEKLTTAFEKPGNNSRVIMHQFSTLNFREIG